MKPQLSCKDLARLVLEGEERRLTLAERVGVRLHLAVCSLCPPFVRQVRFMRRAMGRWRQYGGGDDGGPPGS